MAMDLDVRSDRSHAQYYWISGFAIGGRDFFSSWDEKLCPSGSGLHVFCIAAIYTAARALLRASYFGFPELCFWLAKLEHSLRSPVSLNTEGDCKCSGALGAPTPS